MPWVPPELQGCSPRARTAAHSLRCCSPAAAKDCAVREKGTGQGKETKSCFILQLVGHYRASSFKSFPWALTGAERRISPRSAGADAVRGLTASLTPPVTPGRPGCKETAGCKLREILESGQSPPPGTAAVHYLAMLAGIMLPRG